MTISFDNMPANIRTPFVGVEFVATRASKGPVIQQYVGLIMGQILAAGTGVADTLYRVSSVEDVVALAGRGSLAHQQAIGWFASNTATEVWLLTLDDDGGATAHTHTITFTGTSTEAGTWSGRLGGVPVNVAIPNGTAAAAAAILVEAALDLELDLPHIYSVATTIVTGLARNGGAVFASAYDVRDSYLDGESMPAGLTVAYAETVAGATNPTLTTAIAALGDTWFNIWAHPYTDATSLTAIEAELDRRFGPTVSVDGVAFTSAPGTFSTLTTLGETRNHKSSSIWAQPGINPLTPHYEFSAETAGIIAIYGARDPARPFQTLEYKNAIAPALSDQFTPTERGITSGLLFSGMATTKVGPGGKVVIDRAITTYQTNVAGAPDTAYLDINTLLTLMYLRFSFRVRIQTRYPRHKLADTGTRFGAGQAVITPLIGKGEALGWFDDMEALGLVEGKDQFEEDLIVERNGSDVNRLDWLLSPDLMNQLVVSTAQFAFLL